MFTKRFLLLLLLIIVLGVVGIGWQLYQADDAPRLAAADFTLPLIGQEGTLTLSEQRGQVVVLNFWASWCAPCREEAPVFRQMAAEYAASDVIFIGVATDDELSAAQDFLAEFEITYPNVFDADQAVAHRYNIYALPVTLIIDRDGNIRKLLFSAQTEATLREAIDPLL